MLKILLLRPISVIAFAGMLLSIAGCANRGTVPAVSQAPIALHQGLTNKILPARGGAFSANFAGTGKSSLCGAGRGGKITFSGTGQASFFGTSTEDALGYDKIIAGWGRDYCNNRRQGTVTIASKSKLANSIQVRIAGAGYGSVLISGPPPYWHWTVTSGGGKFRHARGHGKTNFGT